MALKLGGVLPVLRKTGGNLINPIASQLDIGGDGLEMTASGALPPSKDRAPRMMVKTSE